MTEEEWWAATDPETLLKVDPNAGTSRQRRLFVAACCRLVSDWLVDRRSSDALDAVELFADGLIPFHMLSRAERRARTAAGVVGGPPARAVMSAAVEHPSQTCLRDVTNEVALSFGERNSPEWIKVRELQTHILRDLFGNPFKLGMFEPAWKSDTAVSLAKHIYESRDFDTMPILADALQDAGCDNDDILNHCRNPGQVHVRGCWAVDLVLGKS